MGEILVKEKEIVIPGQILAKGMDFLPGGGAFREEDKIISLQIGIINVSGRLIKLIPLTGKYLPKTGDTVIGVVNDMTFSNWYIDIGYAAEASLSMRDGTSEFIDRGSDLSRYYDYGEVVVAKITNVIRGTGIELTMKGPGLRKLTGGKIIKITPSKVPRVIGRQGSMISMIKEKTGCKIIVGQNGRVWVQGSKIEEEELATKAINLIEKKSHIEGLTDEIQKFLDKKGN